MIQIDIFQSVMTTCSLTFVHIACCCVITTLSSQLELLICNPVLRKKLGNEAYHLAETTFSSKETNRCMHKLYQEVLER